MDVSTIQLGGYNGHSSPQTYMHHDSRRIHAYASDAVLHHFPKRECPGGPYVVLVLSHPISNEANFGCHWYETWQAAV